MLRLDAMVAGAFVERMRLRADDVASNLDGPGAARCSPPLRGRHQPLRVPLPPVRRVDDQPEYLAGPIRLEQPALADMNPAHHPAVRVTRHENGMPIVCQQRRQPPPDLFHRGCVPQGCRQQCQRARILDPRKANLAHVAECYSNA
jgi:hypothetical protein